MSDINKEKLFDYMDEKILDLHPFPKESSNYVEKCVLQDLKKSINSGKFDSKNVENASLITTIESQKEEIEQKDKFNVELAKQILTLEKQSKESQAITELAVKGLKKVCYLAPTGTDSFDAADSTLSEIEKLQNV